MINRHVSVSILDLRKKAERKEDKKGNAFECTLHQRGVYWLNKTLHDFYFFFDTCTHRSCVGLQVAAFWCQLFFIFFSFFYLAFSNNFFMCFWYLFCFYNIVRKYRSMSSLLFSKRKATALVVIDGSRASNTEQVVCI